MQKLGAAIIVFIENTMSDRAATEKLFNHLLSAYRGSFLPKVVDGWHRISQVDQNDCKRMNHFFCGLHLMVALADRYCTAINSLESHSGPCGAAVRDYTKYSQSASECTVERFVETTCKMGALGANGKSCCPGLTADLEMIGKKNPFVLFRHNSDWMPPAGSITLKQKLM